VTRDYVRDSVNWRWASEEGSPSWHRGIVQRHPDVRACKTDTTSGGASIWPRQSQRRRRRPTGELLAVGENIVHCGGKAADRTTRLSNPPGGPCQRGKPKTHHRRKNSCRWGVSCGGSHPRPRGWEYHSDMQRPRLEVRH
jgi:hypothetical protein